jgi:hypothetical protein
MDAGSRQLVVGDGCVDARLHGSRRIGSRKSRRNGISRASDFCVARACRSRRRAASVPCVVLRHVESHTSQATRSRAACRVTDGATHDRDGPQYPPIVSGGDASEERPSGTGKIAGMDPPCAASAGIASPRGRQSRRRHGARGNCRVLPDAHPSSGAGARGRQPAIARADRRWGAGGLSRHDEIPSRIDARR